MTRGRPSPTRRRLDSDGSYGELKYEKSCPVESAHTRLRHAHEHWHRVADSYPDPDAFCIDLNAAIQTLRTVTFVLQKEKDRVPGFEEWYEAWRERMKSDELMAWLVAARNQIEKEGDLETASTARVAVKADWGEPAHEEFEVSPLLSPQEVAESIDYSRLPDEVRRHGLLVVERRWVVKDLPDRELLEVLAHCYGVLSTLLVDAHQRCGVVMRAFGGETHAGPNDRPVQPKGPLACMRSTREMRSARLHLFDGELVRTATADRTLTEEQLAEARKRYGDPQHGMAPAAGADLLDHAVVLNETAKRLLVTDRGHATVAFLFTDDSKCQMNQLYPDDQQAKYMIMEKLADEAARIDATGFVHITEAWYAPNVPEDHPHFRLRASERPDRAEGLLFTAATADGRARTFTTPFERRPDGEITLGDTTVAENTFAPFLDPLRRVWAERVNGGA